MDYRPLGRTGVQVSQLCLGTMMFGAWGNTDHDDSIRIIHRALDAGINFVDTADVYSAGESEEIVGKALKGRRDDVVLATKFFMPMGEDPNRRGGSRRWIVRAVEDSLRRLGHRLDRPLPGPPPRARRRRRRDARRADRPRPAGQGPLHRLLVVLRQRRSSRRSGPRASGAWSASAPSSRPTRCSSAASSSTSCRPRSATAWASSPTARSRGGWLSGNWTADSSPTSPARQRLAARFDMSLPENQRKLEAVEQLAAGRRRRRPVADRAGHRLRRQPPGVTSAIIGPRTMEQLDSQLPAADVVLDAAVLDRIDEIVRPGVNLNPADTSYGEQVLQPALRRR